MDKKNIEAITSLSPAQQGMLYETIRAPGSGIHVEQSIATLTGQLDVTAFERAWQWGVGRHASLRTGFVWKGQVEPLQVTLDHVPVAFDYQDWRGVSSVEQHRRVESYLREERRRGFDLAHPPLMRLALFCLDEKVYRFISTSHHILMDGWSQAVLLNEITACYAAYSRGQALDLEPSRPYRDYIAWLKKQDVSEAEQFWGKTLRGFTEPTLLGREQERANPCLQEERYGSQWLQLSNAVTTALQTVMRHHHLTLNTIVQGIWAGLLGRYSGTEDVIFGITVSGRPSDLVGVETMVGLFINTLPLRVQLPAQASLWSWFEELQRQNVEIHRYEYSSAGDIHRWSDVPGMSLLYESLLVVENYPAKTEALAPVNVGTVEVDDTRSVGAQTKYALTFLVAGGAKLGIKCIYDAQRFERSSIEHILAHFQRALHYVASDPQVQLARLSSLIPVDQIPRVYPALTLVQTRTGMSDQAPRGPIEELVAAVWCDVLGLNKVGIERNFFELGGHSLVATQVISRLRAVLGVEVPLRAVFEYPTVAELAQWVVQALRKIEEGEMLPLAPAAPPLVAVARPSSIPLSFAQQRLWFLDQLEPGSTAYLISSAYRLLGALDVECFEQSLEALTQRHESLRTTFAVHADQPVQIIHPMNSYCLYIIDMCEISEDGRNHVIRELVRQEARHPMDLAGGPLLRTCLLRLSTQEHVWLLTLHHIITDGWSAGIFLRELTTLYRAFAAGQPSPLEPLPLQYADYALWQRQWLQGKVLDALLDYWTKRLAGARLLELPTDRPRTTLGAGLTPALNHGAVYHFKLSSPLSHALMALSRGEGVTLFMTLLTAFQIVLSRYTGKEDILVGTDVANRTWRGTEELIGFFVNQLVLRTNLVGNLTFRGVLKQVKQTTLEAYTHQELPFEKLVEVLNPERGASHAPLFRVKVNFRNSVPQAKGPLHISPLELDVIPLKLDVELFLTEGETGIVGSFIYNSFLFDISTIKRWSDQFEVLLENVVENPDIRIRAIELLTQEEKEHKRMDQSERMASSLSTLRQIKARPVSQKNLIKTSYFQPDQYLPLIIQPNTGGIHLVEWVKHNRGWIETELLKSGGILFRGFEVHSPVEFEQVALAITAHLFHENGEHPREAVSENVYTPVFYPPEKKLLWHNENSFNATWPTRIWFYCGKPAEQGGETPIVDNRRVFQQLDVRIRERFMQKHILYVRNYGDGLGLPWQTVFGTTSKAEVEHACRKATIEFVWKEGDRLRTYQFRPAVLKHPQTGEFVWWNQATHWHVACLEPGVRDSLLALYRKEDLPRNCYYGDGSPIEDTVMEAICQVYQQVEISFPWQQGDILMLDNMLTAHARNAYQGERKIYVVMGDMLSLRDIEVTL